MLTECLLGFELLLRKFGGVTISEKSVGLNSAGKCVVWSGAQHALAPQNPELKEEQAIVDAAIDLIKKCS